MLYARMRPPAALSFAALLTLTYCGGAGGNAETIALSEPVQSAVGEPIQSDDFYLGQPRNDVDRFFGLYGDPGRGQFFVTEAKRPEYAEQAPEIPPGYLAIGAMWGDVAPMHMKSLSDTRFQQVDLSDFAPDEPNVVEFEMGPDDSAVALTFTSGSFSDFGRRVRVGELPEEWR